MALLVSIVGLGLAAILLPYVITQNAVSRFDARQAVTIHAAESGLEVALGVMRNVGSISVGGQVAANAQDLPCGPLQGSVGPDGLGSYTVTIAYYTEDPRGMDAGQRAAKRMACSPGSGVYYQGDESSGANYAPRFAVLTATGADNVNRSLQATFTIRTRGDRVPGGLLPLFPSGSSPQQYCLAVSGQPALNSPVTIQKCWRKGDDPALEAPQKWSYLNNLTIRLASTVGDTLQNPSGSGLCIMSPNSSGVQVRLTYCPDYNTDGTVGPSTWNVQWSINNSGHFESSRNSSAKQLSGMCLHVDKQVDGEPVVLKTCSGGTTDEHQAFNPDPSVGSGQAGAPNNQLVNYELFGRCLDVTNQSTATGNNGGSFLILYPCKQHPDPSQVAWNQKFTPVSAGSGFQWRTYPGSGGTYCLTSSGTLNGFVYVSTCQSGNARQIWKDPATISWPYAMVDSEGRCMAPGPPPGIDASSDEYNTYVYNANLKAIVTTCSGARNQWWNADPIKDPSLTNLHESGPGEGSSGPGGS